MRQSAIFRDISKAVAVAFMLAGLAAALRVWPLGAMGTKAIWTTFPIAVVIAANYKGFLIGMLTIIFSCLAVLFVLPIFLHKPIIVEFGDWLGMGVFCTSSIVISIFGELRCRARAQLKCRARAQLEKTRESEAKYTAIVESSADAIISNTLDGIITSWNKGAENIFGYKAHEIIDLPITTIFPPDRLQEELQLLARLKMGESIEHFETVRVRKDGKRIDVSATISPIKDDTGKITGISKVLRDISEQKKAQLSLQNSEQQLRHLLESSPIAIRIASQPDHKILFANPAYVNLIGAENSNIYDINVEILYKNKQELLDTLELLQERTTINNRLFEWQNLKGKTVWVIATFLMMDYKGHPSTIGWFYDVTELREAKARADEASQAKSSFLAAMSHEIRTPMNAIIGLTHLCLETEMNAKQHDYIYKANSAAHALLDIINNVLDFSKIEASKLVLENDDFEIRNVMFDVDSIVGHLARDKGLGFDTAIAADVPLFVKGDAIRLRQVLMNLSSNAVKFTDSGVIMLSVAVKSADAQTVELEFSVRDTGIGLSAETIEKLFQPYTQADSSTSRKYGGTGLGLAICKRLVELMNGRIWITSELDRGSDFFTAIRFNRSSQQPDTIEHINIEANTGHARLKGSRILVVEDNPFNQQVAQELLESVGVNVVLADNGHKALECLAQQSFDIVLMDVQMPEMDGYEATYKIRSTPELTNLCIIAMTANAMEEDRQRCLAAGMNDFITKPINPNQMYLVLTKWLSLDRELNDVDTSLSSDGNSRLVMKTTEMSRSTLDRNAVDLDILRTLVNNQPEKFKKFAYKFLEVANQVLAEMEIAVAKRDLSAIGGLGHKLKSSARAVGAHSFGDLCQKIEIAGKSGDWPELSVLQPQLQPLLTLIANQIEEEIAGK